VSNPVNGGGQYAWVAYYHFINGLGSGITIVGSLDIGCQNSSYFWQMLQKGDGFPLASFLTMSANQLVSLAIMSNTQSDCFRKGLEESGHLNPNGVFQLVSIQYLPVEVTWEEQSSCSLSDLDGQFRGWNKFGVHVGEEVRIKA
jgi:hypothetical protein